MYCWKLLVFLSLYPLLGRCCSCSYFSGRYETLKDGICSNYPVYTGVVVGATCTCLADEEDNNIFDCRRYTYSEEDKSYSDEVINTVRVEGSYGYENFVKTCTQAENVLAQGEDFERTGSEPEVTNVTGSLLHCPFNDILSPAYVCVYQVKVTEVFNGSISVGEVVTSLGPDSGTSCSVEEGRILELGAKYLAGVGGPCSRAFHDWEPLSKFTEGDLEDLRSLRADEDLECGSATLRAVVMTVVTAAAFILLV
jgi:hypothetical protein